MVPRDSHAGEPSAGLNLDLDGVESSYRSSHLGSLLYGLVRSHAPRLVVELGTYHGYAALHFAAALRDNMNPHSRLHLIDLWNSYPYRHCSMETTQDNFARNNLLDLPHCEVSFKEGDAFQSSNSYEDGTIDCLHIDVSNTGDKLKQLLGLWAPKMTPTPDTLIIVEGGSKERDEVAWMVEHQMSPIQSLLSSQWLTERFSYFCFQPFPSLCVLRCRNDSAA